MINNLDKINKISLKQLFLSGLHHYTSLPNKLEPYVKQQNEELSLFAKQIILYLIDNQYKKTISVLKIIQTNINNNTFHEYGFKIVNDIFELINDAFRNNYFRKKFTKKTALITIYFTIIFMISCSRVEIRKILQYQETFVEMSFLCNYLLLNTRINRSSCILKKILSFGCCFTNR